MLVRSVLRIALLAVLAFIPGFASASSSLQVEKAERDGDLEPGFPAQAWEGNGGSYRVGAAIHTLIGNVDADPRLEVIATGIPSGPLYVWNADGSASQAVKVGPGSVAYPAVGQLSHTTPGLDIFSGSISGVLGAYSGSGTSLPGWPRASNNYVSSPAVLADVDGDGLDEVFLGEEDWELHADRADGTVLPGWPTVDKQSGQGSQKRDTPAVADLNGDGDLEIVSGGSDNIVFALPISIPVYPLQGSRLHCRASSLCMPTL